MKSLQLLWTWIKAKFGRIVSASGVFLSGVETLDISPIKDPLEGLIGHKGVLWVTCGLFAASWFRHQWVANQHPKTVSSPPVDPGVVVKP